MSKKLFLPTYFLYGALITEEQYLDEEFNYILDINESDSRSWSLLRFRLVWEFLGSLRDGSLCL